MLIRDAKDTDFTTVADITNHYILHTPIHFSYDPVTADELRESWHKTTPHYPFLVLIDEMETLAGFAKASRWRERKAYDRTAEVGIYLRPDAFRRGLGKMLYNQLIVACRERQFHTLVGGIALPNPASVGLHEACGFTLAGTFRQVGWKFNAWHDVAWYQLML